MGSGFEYVQTKLQVQTRSEVKLLNNRFFLLLLLLFGEGNTLKMYVYKSFQPNLRVVDSFETVLTNSLEQYCELD